MQREKELCLFAEVPVFTIGRLHDYPYTIIAQGELNTVTDAGIRITNRVRATYNSDCGNPSYTTTTKFRVPREKGSIDTDASQVELNISEEDFDTIMASCTTRHLKRRYCIPLPSGVKVEFDRYLNAEEPPLWSNIFKIDIENGDESQVDVYLAELRELGFHLGRIINPPGIENSAIPQVINDLMSNQWNLVKLYE